MKTCIKCGSHAFNLHADGIDQGEFCDVHYWQGRAHRAEALVQPEHKYAVVPDEQVPERMKPFVKLHDIQVSEFNAFHIGFCCGEDFAQLKPQPVQERTDYAAHLRHCNLGEHEGYCKYGDDNCPALEHAALKAKLAQFKQPEQDTAGVTIEASLRFRLDSEKQKSADLLDDVRELKGIIKKLRAAQPKPQPEQPEGDIDFWIRAATEARQAEMQMRREIAKLQPKPQPEQRQPLTEELLKLLKEARKIIRASSSRNLVNDWDTRATSAIAYKPKEAKP